MPIETASGALNKLTVRKSDRCRQRESPCDHSTRRTVSPHRTRPVLNGLKLREVCKLSGSPDAEHQTVWCSPDSYQERFAKRADTSRTPPDAPLASGALSQVYSQKSDGTGRMNRSYLASNAHRPVLDPSRFKRDSTPDAQPLRPVPQWSASTPTTSPNFPPMQYKICTFSQKRRIPLSLHNV